MLIRLMPRPPVAGLPGVASEAAVVIPQSGFRSGRWWYNTGFVGPWRPIRPSSVPDEGRARRPDHRPRRPTCGYGLRALGQIDPGYVAQPAIYDVARTRARWAEGDRSPSKSGTTCSGFFLKSLNLEVSMNRIGLAAAAAASSPAAPSSMRRCAAALRRHPWRISAARISAGEAMPAAGSAAERASDAAASAPMVPARPEAVLASRRAGALGPAANFPPAGSFQRFGGSAPWFGKPGRMERPVAWTSPWRQMVAPCVVGYGLGYGWGYDPTYDGDLGRNWRFLRDSGKKRAVPVSTSRRRPKAPCSCRVRDGRAGGLVEWGAGRT